MPAMALLLIFVVHFDVPHMLDTLSVLVSLRDDLVTTKLGPDLGPAEPVEDTKQENTDTDDGEDVVWVAISVPGTTRRNERHECQEDVGSEIQHSDRKVGVPWRFPTLLLRIVEIDQTGRDEAIDPCSRVGVQIRDEVVRRTSGRCNKHDDCN